MASFYSSLRMALFGISSDESAAVFVVPVKSVIELLSQSNPCLNFNCLKAYTF